MNDQTTNAYAEWIDEGTVKENFFVKYLVEGIDFLSETVLSIFSMNIAGV